MCGPQQSLPQRSNQMVVRGKNNITEQYINSVKDLYGQNSSRIKDGREL